MQIRIHYLRRDEEAPRVLELSTEEYFDPLNEGETLSVRSVAKHEDAFVYTGHLAEELKWTIVEVVDGASFWRVRTQLLEGLQSLMHHSRGTDGSEEIIHQTELSPRCWHTVRTLRQPGQDWAVVMNSLIVEQPCELTVSQDFCGGWSFEELKAFGNVP